MNREQPLLFRTCAITPACLGAERIPQAFVPTFAAKEELRGRNFAGRGCANRNEQSSALPIFGALLGTAALSGVVVVDLALHATQLLDVFAKVAGDEFLTTGGVGEAGVSQLLAVRTQNVLLGAEESVDALFFFGKI